MPNRFAQELASRDKLRTQGINTLPGRTPSQLMSVDQFHRSIPWYEHLLGGLTGQDVALPPGPNDPVLAEVPLSPGDLRSLVNALGKATKRSHPAVVASKNWYHGTASDLSPVNLDPTATKSSRNLFGPGIYLTDDAAGIPQGYAKSAAKRANRHAKKVRQTLQHSPNKPRGFEDPAVIEEKVYEARVQPRKILDLEEDAPLEVREIFKDLDASLREHTYLDEGKPTKVYVRARAHPEFQITTGDLYDGLKKDLADPDNFDGLSGMLSYEADDIFSMLAEDLRRKGYDALTHTGGLRTGNKPHQVLIMLDPNDYYNVRGMSSLEGPPGISKQPFLPGGEVSSFRRFRLIPPRR